jgi:uncharacterized delta-60 repeat protein
MNKTNYIRTIILAGGLLLQVSTLGFHSHGAAGDVDLSFDPGSGVNGTVNAVVVQLDGKVIIAGEFTTVKGLARSGIARLNADGSGDPAFNPNTGVNNLTVANLALQPDGKILICGQQGSLGGFRDGYAARLNSDGTLDSSFTAAAGSYPYGSSFASVVAQSDGKVLLGGSFVDYYLDNDGYTWYYSSYLLVRLNTNGTFDTSVAAGYCGGFCFAGDTWIGSVTLQPDGKVLITGNLSPSGHRGVFRLNADFSGDSSFNPGTGPNNDLFSIALQPDGKVLIGGYFTAVNGTNRNGIARLNANGSLDSSFNPGTGANYVYSVGLQPDGKVLIFGLFTAFNGTNRNGLAQLNANGSLDLSFNPGTGIGGYSPVVNSFGAQTDGKVLIGGNFTTVNGTNRNYIARLSANGSLDHSFNPGRGLGGPVSSLVVQPDDKLLVGLTFTFINGTNRYGSARLNGDGNLDDTFIPASFYPDLSGFYHLDCPPGYQCFDSTEVTAVAVQPDGKVLIGGYSLTIACEQTEGVCSNTYRYFVGRCNANGTRDPSFEPAVGPPVLGTTPSDQTVSALALQPDGKVIVGGIFTSIKGTNRAGIARLNADGSLDGSFDPGTNAHASVSAVALRSDGKVLIGGYLIPFNGTPHGGIARLNPNGSLDESFNPGTGANGSVYSVTLQPDGKVLMGGLFTAVNGANRNRIARLNADGSLDSHFDPGTGADAEVRSIVLQSDGKVLIAGPFLTVNGVGRRYVARLHGDSAAPVLNLVRSNALMILSWPVTGLNFQLQETTDVLLPNSWSPVAQPAVTNGNQVSVTVPTTAPRRFFRLQSQ